MPDTQRTIPRAPRIPRRVVAVALLLAVAGAGAPAAMDGPAGVALGAVLTLGAVGATGLAGARAADRLGAEAQRRVDVLGEELEHARRVQTRLRADLRTAADTTEAAEDARRRAEAADRAKTTFLSNLSRELRTPLNNVLGLSGILLDTSLTDSQRDYTRTVHGAAEALIALVDDVLDLCRVEVGDLSLDRREFELGYCLESVVETCRASASERSPRLSVELDPSLPTWLVGDRIRVRQVLMALLTRAVERAEASHVVLRARGVGGEGPEVGVRFEIAYQGEVHETAEPKGDLAGSGRSVALALATRLVARMEGTFEGDPLEGACAFTAAFARGRAVEPSAASGAGELAGRRMLVVSADEDACATVHATALRLGVRCHAAGTGTDGLSLLRDLRAEGIAFGVIVIDADLPDVGGLELAGILRQAPEASGAGCILLRPAGSPERPDQLARLGFDAWVRKPLSETRLSTAILHVTAEPVLERDGGGAARERALEEGSLDAAVLLAEDNLVNQKVMALLLERLGCRVRSVRNGMDAIEQVMTSDFDVVLMDCAMPELDGLEATRAIRRLSDPVKRQIPIVALTASAGEQDRRACLDAGMNAFLPKPVRAAKLAQVLRHWAGAAGHEPPEEPMQDPSKPVDPDVLASLKELGGDDPSIFVELVDLFLSDTPPRLEQLENAQRSGDADTIVASAHALKSSCGNLGAVGLSNLCRDIESRGRSGDVESVGSLIAACRQEYDRVEEALRREVG